METLTPKEKLIERRLRLVIKYRSQLDSGERVACKECHLVIGADGYGAGDGHVARVCEGYELMPFKKGKKKKREFKVIATQNECVLHSVEESHWE